MATAYLTSAPTSPDAPASMSPADSAAHAAASHVRPTQSRRLVAAGVKRGTEPLTTIAVEALHRLELALAEQTVANFDNHGSLWGFSTTEETEAEIAESLAEGATVEEWEITDRTGQPLRVVRVAHPKWGNDIRVTSSWPTAPRRAHHLLSR
ncbi:hypothetical protein [Streptomyces flavidovirens]